MKNELDPTKVLHAYETVMANGTPTEYGKMYEGVEAFSDYAVSYTHLTLPTIRWV